jgi:predicted site-specific integrase-resolvase
LGEVDKIVVMDKDRLLRFGFEIIEYLASLYGCEIEVIDHTEKTEEQELVEDLVQIITVFSCKLQGRRANKARKMIKELMENDSSKKNQTQAHG